MLQTLSEVWGGSFFSFLFSKYVFIWLKKGKDIYKRFVFQVTAAFYYQSKYQVCIRNQLSSMSQFSQKY